MHFGVIGGCLLGGFTAIIANYQNKSQENIQTSPQTVNQSMAPVSTPMAPNPDIIQDHIQQRQENKKFITYSKLHKQPLAIHSLISSQEEIYSSPQNILPQQQTVSQFFHKYSKNLLKNKKCDSVELIEGPIFRKQSKYKTKDEAGKQTISNQIFKNHLYIDNKGIYKTKHFYEVVICNTNSKHYINGFTVYQDHLHPSLNLVNKITSLIQIQEKTGLKFNVEGESLAQIDFQQMNKERNWSYEQIIKEQKEE